MSYPNSAQSPYQQHHQLPPQQPQQQQQQQQQYPMNGYQPYSAHGSPQNQSPYAPPPAKRQRLSPDPRSPQAYQNGNYHQAPPPQAQPYGNPYAQSPAPMQAHYSPTTNIYTSSPQQSFNSPQPHPQQPTMQWQSQPSTPAAAPAPVQRNQMGAGSPQQPNREMPPPPKPNKEDKDERVGVDDLNDAMHGSGVNLKDEEALLHNWDAPSSFGPNSFSRLRQSGSFNQSAGTLGTTASQEEIDAEVSAKRSQAAREKAEREQHHLANPFLLGNVVRQRVDKLARENGVRLAVDGLYILQNEPTRTITNADGTEGLVRPGSKIDQQAPFGDILSLVSLAAGERLRALLSETHTLARARQAADQNRVPPDFADLATGPNPTTTSTTAEGITNTPWDRPRSSSSSSQTPQQTLSFQSSINTTFASLATSDRLAEEARLARRAARAERLAKAAETAPDDAPLPDAPAPDETPKISKKEQIRLQKAARESSEAQLSATTNQTAALMALGGGKKKKYAWMTGASGSMPSNRYAKPVGGGTPAPGTPGPKTPVKVEGGVKEEEGGKKVEGRVWGSLKEGEERGMQARDLVLVLERDGREGKTLQRVLGKMG